MLIRLRSVIAQFSGFFAAHQQLRLLGFSLLAACLALQPLARGQEKPAQEQKPPFIEPAETHEKQKVKVFVEAQPHVSGRWDTLPFLMPINPVHVALMHTGKVLVVSGSGNDPNNHVLQAGVWDPKTDTMKTFIISYDMFCNGMVIMPDGRPFLLGGTLRYDPFFGYPKTSLFNPATETFASGPDMSGGRWYPTGTVLGNGSVLVLSGLTNTSSTLNTTVQIGNGVSWTPAGTVFAGAPLYPREHLLASGKVFEDGDNPDSQMYDPVAHTWSFVATTKFGAPRQYGTSVLLPLTPADAYKPKVIILGGHAPDATDTTELIDLSAPSPAWVNGPKMVGARIQLNATILPDGKVLVSGGSSRDEDTSTAVLQAQLFHPDTNTFTSGSTMEYPRVYHSNTLLLPDGKVLALGGNPRRGEYEAHMEIYSPPYLFKSDGSPAKRPVTKAVAPLDIHYGGSFTVNTPEAATIKSVVLVRAGSVTHAFDMDQRLVGLSFKAGSYVLQVKAPANGNLAPPGYYLLFILDEAGVPSVGRFVHLNGGVRKVGQPAKISPGKQ